MPRFAMPIVYMIEAENLEEAHKSIVEWVDETDLNDMPAGTEDVDYELTVDQNDDGQRVIHLPPHEDEEDIDTIDDDKDDFNDADLEDLD